MTPPRTAPPIEFGDPKRAKMMRAVCEDAKSRAGLFRRVYSGTASPRMAIKAQCLHCAWMDERAIRDCTATQCPLHGLRPFQPKGQS